MKKSGIISAAIMLFAAGSLCARVLTLGGSDILRSVVEDGVDIAQDGFIAKGLVYMLDFYHGFLLF